MDDKTIALTGEYAPARSPAQEPPVEPKAYLRRIHNDVERGAGGGSSSDTADETPDSEPTKDTADHPKSRTAGNLSQDPLDRLIQSLPSDLKVIDLINLAAHPARQISGPCENH